jgi:4-hydroxythreonine-4-phosphate dehydrogenase
MIPRIVVSIGCPAGIGPEVSIVAAADTRVLLVGDLETLVEAATLRGVPSARLVSVEDPADAWRLEKDAIPVWQPTPDLSRRDHTPGTPTPRSGTAQLAWIDAACDIVSEGHAHALVTGPVSKDIIGRAPEGEGFLGHTEYLQHRLGAREVVMAFACETLTTALVTTHIPLSEVPKAVTSVAVARTCFWLGDLLVRLKRRRREPSIAVAGLNPHAGEHGRLGNEESKRLVPGMERARKRLLEAGIEVTLQGPVPAETAFRLAAAGEFDGVVAMYHDQATIPMKLLGFGEAVNVSLGLPIVRTSVDHGTAYDRAGEGTADARGMREAVALAARLVRRNHTQAIR